MCPERALIDVSISEQLRWRDAYRALAGWKSALEASGVLVLQFSMPREDARGFVLESEQLPIIAVSTKDAPEARVFSLFHEYCHLAIGYEGVSRPTEADADEGADQRPGLSRHGCPLGSRVRRAGPCA